MRRSKCCNSGVEAGQRDELETCISMGGQRFQSGILPIVAPPWLFVQLLLPGTKGEQLMPAVLPRELFVDGFSKAPASSIFGSDVLTTDHVRKGA